MPGMKLMSQGELHIAGTEKLPSVIFLPGGQLKIEGRILHDSVCDFTRPLMKWVRSFTGKNVIVDIKTDYLSQAGLSCITTLLQTLEKNSFIKNILLNWYYDADDEEYFEKGLYLEDKLKRTMVNHISYLDAC